MNPTQAAPEKQIGRLARNLGIHLLLVCAALLVGFFAFRAFRNGGRAPGDAERKSFTAWLAHHPEYRAAADADCACDDLLRMNPTQHLYTATGDFNRDGKQDFAAAVIDTSTGKFALLVFNGPGGGAPRAPALFLKNLDLRRQALFFDLPFEQPPHLYYGYLGSDDLWRFVPKGGTYTVEYVRPTDPSETTAVEPLQVEARHFDRTLPGCGDETNGCAHAEVDYVEAVAGPPAARERINREIVSAMSGSGYFVPDIHSVWRMIGIPGSELRKYSPESLAQDFLDDYETMRKYGDKEFPGVTMHWTLTRQVKVLRMTAPVFSAEFTNEYRTAYGGRLAGLEGPIRKYLNFDPVTGEPVKLASILRDGAKTRLDSLAAAHVRQTLKLPETAKLFTLSPDGRFTLSDDCGFGDTALQFRYYTDDLIEIPYSELHDLLRPEVNFPPTDR
jgi:hypothetical protein